MRASLAILFITAACGGSSPEPSEPAPPVEEAAPAEPAPAEEAPAEEAAPAEAAPAEPAADSQAVEAQATRGAELYGKHCAGCHGDAGQGGKKAPPLVGEKALPADPRKGSKRKVQFNTALDVFTWVKANMPPKKAGSLADDEYVAILAFDLKANGVTLDRPLDAEVASTLNLH